MGILTSLLCHLIVAGYFLYVTYHFITTRDSCVNDCELRLCSSYGMLLLVIGSTYIGLLYFKVVKKSFESYFIKLFFDTIIRGIKSLFKSSISKIILLISVLALIFSYVTFESQNDFTRLRAVAGIILFLMIGFMISANPRRIIWRPVICGAILQFILGVVFIRWPVGRKIFECFGQKVSQFLDYGKEGAAFVYGDFLVYDEVTFAFGILPILYFFSTFVSVLYYLGVMQWVLIKLGYILQILLGTTVCESVNAAGNIFIGQDSVLLIAPYFRSLTHSEIHAVMTSGMSTITGSLFAAYTTFGAKPQHLITSIFMAAPTSLFLSKLVYPELEKSQTSTGNIQLEKSTCTSLIDAASTGASQGTNIILNIISNLISFVAFVIFTDGLIKWTSHLAGFENVGFEFLLGKIFMPVSWMIGVDWEDCDEIGNVIGLKTIVNEFVAFSALGKYIENGEISERSAAIATFAICSFANLGTVGITIGYLSSFAPERRHIITKVALRSFITACFVTLVTASTASLLMP